jgi:hypothetical protein
MKIHPGYQFLPEMTIKILDVKDGDVNTHEQSVIGN